MHKVTQEGFTKTQYVRDLRPGQAVHDLFLLTGIAERAGRRGDGYLVLTLTDRTGHICAFGPRQVEPLFIRALLRVAGRTRRVADHLEIVAHRLELVVTDVCDLAEFTPAAPQSPGVYLARLRELVSVIPCPAYRALISTFLADPVLLERFCAAPASLADHHAYRGGLLQHTGEVMDAAYQLALGLPSKRLDLGVLLTAAFFHDIGKIDAYSGPYPYQPSPVGRWVDHQTLGLRLVLRAVDAAPDLSPAAAGRLLALLARRVPSRRSIPDALFHEAIVLEAADGLSAGLGRPRPPAPYRDPGEVEVSRARVQTS